MSDVIMNTREIMEFPRLCRELRLAKGLKQREVAVSAGMNPKSYGNVECTSHKVVAKHKVDRLALCFGLSDFSIPTRQEFVSAWESLPQSSYSANQAKGFDRRKAHRSKAKAHDLLRASLLEIVTLVVTTAPDPDTLCACPPMDVFTGDPVQPCELCSAMHLLGVSEGFTTVDQAVSALAERQEAGPT